MENKNAEWRIMEIYEIPHAENEFYYDGLRAVFTSFTFSMLGAIFYSLLQHFDVITNMFFSQWVGIIGLMVYTIFITWVLKKIKNRCYVFLWMKPPVFRPRVAKLSICILQIITGVLCALIFDFMAYVPSVKSIFSALVIVFLYSLTLYCFSKSSIKALTPLR